MPPFEAFRNAESYCATLAHERPQWTRHPSRLDRDLGRKRWDNEGYAMEELVAELGSVFLAAHLELTPETRKDRAAYNRPPRAAAVRRLPSLYTPLAQSHQKSTST